MTKDEKVDSKDPLAHELAYANQALREQKKGYERQIKGFKGQIASLQGGKHGGSQADPSQTEDNPSQTEKEAKEDKPIPPHYVASWQETCPGCSEPNPAFKDEMRCNSDKGGCGRKLGEAKEAAKLEMCPYCGKGEFLQIAGEKIEVPA